MYCRGGNETKEEDARAQLPRLIPRFTAEYCRRVENFADLVISEADARKGWAIIPAPEPGNQLGKAWVQHWLGTSVSRGQKYFLGDLKLTWQVLALLVVALLVSVVAPS